MFQQMDDWESIDKTLRKQSKDANAPSHSHTTSEQTNAAPVVAYREEIGRMSASNSFASATMLTTGIVVNKRHPTGVDSS